jgi:hypothetical protein
MGDTKAIVRATGTVTYDTPAVPGGGPMAAAAPADATQFGRLKALFDELGVKYEIQSGKPRSQFDLAMTPGEKWLVMDEGKGFTNCFASFGFTVDGQFLGYYVTG